jgi:predicted DCC family thiol-disulfide oxidoreductase YuxK
MILIEGDRALMRSDAVLAVTSRLGMPWRLLTIARIIPRPLRDAAYRWIARNRHQWFGGADSCHLPSPALREQMLD